MNVFTLHTNRRNPKGMPIFIRFGCDIPDLKAFVAELNKGKAVYGWNLRTRWARDEEGECLEIIEKTPYGITPAGITGVENPRHRFVEFTEE